MFSKKDTGASVLQKKVFKKTFSCDLTEKKTFSQIFRKVSRVFLRNFDV